MMLTHNEYIASIKDFQDGCDRYFAYFQTKYNLELFGEKRCGNTHFGSNINTILTEIGIQWGARNDEKRRTFVKCYANEFGKTEEVTRKNIQKWINEGVFPDKDSVVCFVFALIKYNKANKKDYDYVDICSKLLMAAGYDALHSRNFHDALIIYCFNTKKEYKNYTDLYTKWCKDELIKEYLENLPRLSFDLLSENIDTRSIQGIREHYRNIEKKNEEDVISYTTHFCENEIAGCKTDADFKRYVKTVGEHWTAHRNSTVKTLVYALYNMYVPSDGENNKLSFSNVAKKYESFYLYYIKNNLGMDLLTLNPRRKNSENCNDATSRHIVYDDTQNGERETSQGEAICDFRTPKDLTDMLNGNAEITRNRLVAWLIFAGAQSGEDIDSQLNDCGYLPILGNEDTDPLSSFVSTAFFLSSQYNKTFKECIQSLSKLFLENEVATPLYDYRRLGDKKK